MKSMSHLSTVAAALLEARTAVVGIGRIEESAVTSAYRRWAPVYDHTFGLVAPEDAGTPSR